ncbi:hypothetical protein FA15DRAFT_710278 [Coprinopsis marcescibilis]|uniref:Uncharacterized protein n=1 Tax=Coprinopsis marcescibilis TaxID=230819 RepID=A0A5C3KE91_COPMA|nr:hypothetical protein FA15DRAFT_710278 [Coprinopsis marcescibilis]
MKLVASLILSVLGYAASIAVPNTPPPSTTDVSVTIITSVEPPKQTNPLFECFSNNAPRDSSAAAAQVQFDLCRMVTKLVVFALAFSAGLAAALPVDDEKPIFTDIRCHLRPGALQDTFAADLFWSLREDGAWSLTPYATLSWRRPE